MTILKVHDLFVSLPGPGEEAQVSPVHPSRPESRQGASTADGLVLRQATPAAAAVPAAADPQSATAALQLPHHPACPSQVSTNSGWSHKTDFGLVACGVDRLH